MTLLKSQDLATRAFIARPWIYGVFLEGLFSNAKGSRSGANSKKAHRHRRSVLNYGGNDTVEHDGSLMHSFIKIMDIDSIEAPPKMEEPILVNFNFSPHSFLDSILTRMRGALCDNGLKLAIVIVIDLFLVITDGFIPHFERIVGIYDSSKGAMRS